METTGTVTGTGTPSRIEHVKAQLIRNLIGAYDVEIEVMGPSSLHRQLLFRQRPHSCIEALDGLRSSNTRMRMEESARQLWMERIGVFLTYSMPHQLLFWQSCECSQHEMQLQASQGCWHVDCDSVSSR